MPKFLNREGIVRAIEDLFESALGEIIIAVPYIQLSEKTYKNIKSANDRNIEITIIYRENGIKDIEKNKLFKLENLNLLSHPDIHTKFYAEDNSIIIGSMNLYEYSQKYNREMAVQLYRNDLFIGEEDESDLFGDAVSELQDIIRSAKFEKKSRRTLTHGFNLSFLKLKKELNLEICAFCNKFFDNKKFELDSNNDIFCKNYYDNIDIYLEFDIYSDTEEAYELHRAIIVPKWAKSKIEKIHSEFKPFIKNPDSFPNFVTYWDNPKTKFTIYKDRKNQKKWNELNTIQLLKKMKQGIELVTDKVREIERKLR